MHKNRATRLRNGTNLEMTASATSAKQKIKDGSIDNMCSVAHRDVLK
jgi:hypothetical protein